MKRIGFVGTENSHVDHFIRFLNTEERHAGYHAEVLSGGENERNTKLASGGGITTTVGEPTELIGQVEGAIVATRDGGKHAEQAIPLLEAGVAVLVDKPLAVTVDEADKIIAAAEKGNTTIVSSSALRFVPEMEQLKDEANGPIQHITVAGAADPDSEYSGLSFYGIHHIETAFEILGNPTVQPGESKPYVVREGDRTVATVTIGDAVVTFVFVVPGEQRVPFHASVVRSGGVTASNLTLSKDYNAPSLQQFIEHWEAGTSLAPETLRSPIVVLESIMKELEAQA